MPFACSKDYGASILLICDAAYYLITRQDQLCHLRLEVHLTAAVDDGVPHRFNHLRQPVGTDVRMGICQDGR